MPPKSGRQSAVFLSDFVALRLERFSESGESADAVIPSVAIVTGASSGIGRATAIRLSRDFSAVVLVAREADGLREVAEQVTGQGAQALPVETDLMAPGAAEIVVSRAVETFGRIDALLNIAGAVPAIDLFQMSDQQWNSGIELKLHGARRLTLQAWAALKASKGSVVLISGNTAEVPTASNAAVGVVNAAVVALAKAFADRGLRDGVQVNSVSPGPVMTARRLGMIEKWAAARRVPIEEAKQTLLSQSGIARYGEPHDIAELMAYLVSPAARWIAGTQVRIDGGEVKST
jgi:3-oxoacyl-[acyl-carrier protein] reductase